MSERLTLSPLGHTWILDLDGTIVRHDGYLIDGRKPSGLRTAVAVNVDRDSRRAMRIEIDDSI